MNASAWSNGAGLYGIRVGVANRDAYFNRSWTEIAVELDGLWHMFAVTGGFWNDCPEFRDRDGIISSWLVKHYGSLDWPTGHPWEVVLMPLSGNGFRLIAIAIAQSSN
jgi:hypothetical protein